jgi:hypothetical protein
MAHHPKCREIGSELPALAGNPLLHRHRLAADLNPGGGERVSLIRQYSFATPTEEALEAIATASPRGVVELGAGTGYWARLLYERGVDVIAYDVSPPPSSDSQWFAGATPWYPVERDDGRVVTEHADRTLLLVWPTRDESWAARAAIDFHKAGGRSLVYVGEGPGGPTGDDELHAVLGHYDRCLACAYALADRPCICRVGQRWKLHETAELPHWEGLEDDLRVYQRLNQPSPVPCDCEAGRQLDGRPTWLTGASSAARGSRRWLRSTWHHRARSR